MKKVVVLAFNNCLTSSIIGILDVLAVSNIFNSPESDGENKLFDIQIAAISLSPVMSFNAQPIHPTMTIEEIKSADIIIIPPIMTNFETVLDENRVLIPWIKVHAKNSETLICSICTGIFFLAEAGLLHQKSATTNPMITNLIASRYPTINLNVEEILVDLGQVITSGTTCAFVDLIIYLLERDHGSNIARQIAKLFLHDKNRRSQSPYLSPPVNKLHKDREILTVQTWLDKNFSNDFSISQLAERCHMSSRNFVRRFQDATGETPTSYIQILRVELAKKELEATQKTVSEIVYEIGYQDQKSFGRLFKKHTTLTPTEYRKRFSTRVFP